MGLRKVDLCLTNALNFPLFDINTIYFGFELLKADFYLFKVQS